MSSNKKRKEIDKAIRHLIDYIMSSDKWGPLFDELTGQLLVPIADHYDEDIRTINGQLSSSPYEHMSFGFLFEEMATSRWNNESDSPIDAYLKKRGWREGSSGRQYLRALNQSHLELLEVTRVEPGQWVECRPYGTEEKSLRIIEKGASQGLHVWSCIVARVLKVGSSLSFSGSILPLNRNSAADVHERLTAVPDDLKQIYQEMLEEGDVEGITLDLVDEIPTLTYERQVESAFMYWAIEVLALSRPT